MFLSILLISYFTGWIIPNGNSGVTEIRLTPRREIKEMTVNQFQELTREFLRNNGYEVTEEANDVVVQKSDKQFHVEYDFEARASDPRTINSMMVDQKKRDEEGLILFTLATVDGQAKKLAERSGIEIIDPETIINWKRENE